MKKVYLGNDTTTIQSQVFTNCSALETLIIDSEQVPSLQHTNAFLNCNNVTIYVRDVLLEEFKVKTNWTSIADKIKPLSEYVEEAE